MAFVAPQEMRVQMPQGGGGFVAPESMREQQAPAATPAPPTRPPFPTTGTPEAFGRNVQAAGQAAGRLGGATARTVGHNLLPFLVEQETPEQGAMFDRAMIDLLLTGAGAGAGGALTRAGAEIIKGLGRGGMTRAGAGRFLAQNPQQFVASGQPKTTTFLHEALNPAISGSLAGTLTDVANPGQGAEFIDSIAAATVGTSVAGITGREAAHNLLLGNPRWRDLVTRDPRGTAGKVLGGVLGYLGSKLGEVSVDTFNDAADYVAGLFGGEEQSP